MTAGDAGGGGRTLDSHGRGFVAGVEGVRAAGARRRWRWRFVEGALDRTALAP